ncbi:riboflavin synthase [Desulfospira joergensenii]|uniref:riboflavin synthase n=1 Tax=Desulfospira joergensenii TaxID=53329 RepID=UPI0003B7A3B0|nr:riboflavin synthase [Desulfospira joergensenii]
MFTGIIESFGTIKRVESAGEGKILQIATDLELSDTRIGDSIAVNGACLTAVRLGKNDFSVDVAPETISRTTLKTASAGTRVNIERAMRLSARIDGHLVSGHIDGTGIVKSLTSRSNALILEVSVDPDLARDMIEKGSVALEGISLTLNRCWDTGFEVSIIPHTASVTTIGLKRIGDRVNIETDMLGKYVRKILTGNVLKNRMGKPDQGISMETLAKNGFL